MIRTIAMLVSKFAWLGWHQLVCFSLVGATCLLGGCAIYLHDGDLQKQTANALDGYKSADVMGAIKAALDSQSQLDKNDIQAVLDNETAERERAVAELITSYPRSDPPQAINRLRKRIDSRLAELTGGTSIDPKDWNNLTAMRIEVATSGDDLQRQLQAKVRAFKAAGGKGFTTCDAFAIPLSPTDANQQNAARRLKAECDIVKLSEDQLSYLRGPGNSLLQSVKSGSIFTVRQQVSEVTDQIKAETNARNDALAALDQTRDQLKRDGKDPAAIDNDVRAKLQKLDDVLTKLDKDAGMIGEGNFSPGRALAAIQFRKTNLRDIIAESGKSAASGTPSNTDATQGGRAVVGVIAGIIKLRDTSDGAAKAPSMAALSVALAFQDGLEKTVQAQFDALTQKKTLLQDQQDALLREVELLAAAKDAVSLLDPNSCGVHGFGELFVNAGCAAGRPAAARALSAYNLSWASGRTPARIADRKISQIIVWEQLRVSQEAAAARANIQSIALTELAAYGDGGVKADTIAAFLQALGVGAVAYRVK